MSYALIVSEVRNGLFEERNLDAIGLSALMKKEARLLVPNGEYNLDEKLVDQIIRVKMEETLYLNPLNLVSTLERVFSLSGTPDAILFSQSSFGLESAAYVAGSFGFPVISDVSGFEAETGSFLKSYYSDKIFGQFAPKGGSTVVLTVRSGSFKDMAVSKGGAATVEIDAPANNSARTFVEYVEEEKSEIDVTKADFLLSIGRGVGSKDDVPKFEELAKGLGATLSCSRPVVDKLWLPKPHQVGTSGKTVKPRVYLALGISGAFQHVAGMKDSDCIIAVNKDAGAPIFQYAHYGIVADMHKVADKLGELVKGG
jgi:electron transfer flavoprotein alpha subunit